MLTESELNSDIKNFAHTITEDPLLGLVTYAPEKWASPMCCFANVQTKIQSDGGREQFGWVFNYRVVAHIPGPGYLIAVHHTVWNAPDGQVIDITPFHDDPKHQPYHSSNNSVLFLLDREAIPVITDVKLAPLPSRFYALNNDERLKMHLEELRQNEEAECKKIYEVNS